MKVVQLTHRWKHIPRGCTIPANVRCQVRVHPVFGHTQARLKHEPPNLEFFVNNSRHATREAFTDDLAQLRNDYVYWKMQLGCLFQTMHPGEVGNCENRIREALDEAKPSTSDEVRLCLADVFRKACEVSDVPVQTFPSMDLAELDGYESDVSISSEELSQMSPGRASEVREMLQRAKWHSAVTGLATADQREEYAHARSKVPKTPAPTR